jgi:NAD(P)-dependent dehydrogenase (short-subunit alcohol dehydrogenase family)
VPLVARIRAEGGTAHAFGSDARKEGEVVKLIAQHIEQAIAPVEVAVFNVGGNVRFGITETTERADRKVWAMGCYAGLLVGREVTKAIVFTGAIASRRGAAGFAAFAGAKHGLRALAQSMARELGTRGIHLANIVIDGAIDTQFIQDMFPERYALKGQDGILNPNPPSRRVIGRCISSIAAPGRTSAICDRGSRSGDALTRHARCDAHPGVYQIGEV